MSKPASFARIDLEQSRKQAKDLVKAYRAGDREALEKVRWNHPRYRGLSPEETRGGVFLLADAQLVIARLTTLRVGGTCSTTSPRWTPPTPDVARFENAADAVIAGDVSLLRGILREHPDLIRQCSTRAHQSTLLHYISANGVKDYRQITPDNILDIATLLLDAGGDMRRVEALFGQSSQQQREAASIVAAQRGHLAIVQFLLDNGVDVAASDGMTALHQASAGGHLAVMDLLLARGAPLETLNTFGGTVLSSTVWFGYHVKDEEFRQRNYPRVFERLIEAGARTDFYPELLDEIREVNRRWSVT